VNDNIILEVPTGTLLNTGHVQQEEEKEQWMKTVACIHLSHKGSL
jgi:hypothetical protein